MGELLVISGLDAVKAFERAGWRVARQKGSHIILVKKGEMASLSIPNHKTFMNLTAPHGNYGSLP